jgi:hypothetical protein
MGFTDHNTDPFSTPTKPSMHIIDINLVGAIYTFKLAVHYFRRSPTDAERDRCFIFIGSVAGILDNLVSSVVHLIWNSL